MKSLVAAISFLTRLPVGRWVEFDAADVARSAGWFPAVGLLLGAIAAGAAFLLRDHLPLMVVAVILVALEAVLTGGLHFDGLADTFDGFGGGKTREDVLRIMRDHCIGSYGGTALVLLVVLKVSAYGALLQGNQWLPALVLVPALGRWSILLLTATLPYARQSSSVVRDMGRSSIVWGSLTVAIALDGFKLWVPMIAVIALSFLFGSYCRRRIGGITGDTLGANSQLCECAALVTLLWTFHA